jgi:hypothetical protein
VLGISRPGPTGSDPSREHSLIAGAFGGLSVRCVHMIISLLLLVHAFPAVSQ